MNGMIRVPDRRPIDRGIVSASLVSRVVICTATRYSRSKVNWLPTCKSSAALTRSQRGRSLLLTQGSDFQVRRPDEKETFADRPKLASGRSAFGGEIAVATRAPG